MVLFRRGMSIEGEKAHEWEGSIVPVTRRLRGMPAINLVLSLAVRYGALVIGK